MNEPWDIYEQHLDEAAFLWEMWERALISPRHHLRGVVDLETRLLAHLEGLAEGGGAVAETLLLPALEAQAPTRVSAAAFALLRGESSESSDALRGYLESAAPMQQTAIFRTLELLGRESLPAWVGQLLSAPVPALQAMALILLGERRMLPAAHLMLHAASPNPQIAVAALRALARSGDGIAPATLARVLDSEHPSVRQAAIEAGLAAGHRIAWDVCLASMATPGGRVQKLLVAIGGDERDLRRLRQLLTDPQLCPEVLWALGFGGRVADADACMEFIEDTPVRALAGEAFSSITGLQFEGPSVAQFPEQNGEPVPLEQDDLKADLVPSAEDELPVPDAAFVAQWWREARPRFSPQQRYFQGKVLDGQRLVDALEGSSMRRRHAWAQELLLRSRGQIHITTRGLALQQAPALRALRAAASDLWARPFTEGCSG